MMYELETMKDGFDGCTQLILDSKSTSAEASRLLKILMED